MFFIDSVVDGVFKAVCVVWMAIWVWRAGAALVKDIFFSGWHAGVHFFLVAFLFVLAMAVVGGIINGVEFVLRLCAVYFGVSLAIGVVGAIVAGCKRVLSG